MTDTIAEFRIPTKELRDDIPFYTKVLGMRMDMIYPADDPRVAVFSGHGLRLRVEKDAPRESGNPAHPDRKAGQFCRRQAQPCGPQRHPNRD